jgi:hypothetical protein
LRDVADGKDGAAGTANGTRTATETLHSDRAAKDERIEAAAAEVFLGLN